MNTTQHQTLDRMIDNGWRRVHTRADGTIVLRRTNRRLSGFTTYESRYVLPNGSVVDPDDAASRKKTMTVVLIGVVLVLLFPVLLIPIAGWVVWMGWQAIRVTRRDAKAKVAACAVCRGDRDGTVILQSSDASLCQSHWQQRHRIEQLEASLLR